MDNRVTVSALVVLLALIGCCTFLVAIDQLEADLFMGVVVGPAVGGLVAVVAGVKGVQQGTEAALSPPPEPPLV